MLTNIQPPQSHKGTNYPCLPGRALTPQTGLGVITASAEFVSPSGHFGLLCFDDARHQSQAAVGQPLEAITQRQLLSTSGRSLTSTPRECLGLLSACLVHTAWDREGHEDGSHSTMQTAANATVQTVMGAHIALLQKRPRQEDKEARHHPHLNFSKRLQIVP